MRSSCFALFLHLIGKSMLIVAHDMTACGVEIPSRFARGTNSRNFLLCGALLSVAFLPLWPSGVPGSSRIYLPFPSQCKMESGWWMRPRRTNNHRCRPYPHTTATLPDPVT
jgi:hypothetical protein